MDSVTLMIRDEIRRQFKSVKKFSEKSGIPYSTLSNALNKGIGGTSFDTVVKICNLLNLKQVYADDLIVFNDQFHDICLMLTKLDDIGIHTIKTVLSVEYERCNAEVKEDNIRGFNGLVFASEKL